MQYPMEKIPSPSFPRVCTPCAATRTARERCIACKLCEAVWALAITIDCAARQRRFAPHHALRHRPVQMHLLRLLRGSCPVDAIVETDIHEYHFEQRGENIMTKDSCSPSAIATTADFTPHRRQGRGVPLSSPGANA